MLLAYPWMLLLLPLPLLVRHCLPGLTLHQSALWVPFLARLAEASGTSPEQVQVERRTPLQWAMLVSVWLGIVLALARPQTLGEPIEEWLPIRDTLVAVDLSGSMETEDFSRDDATPVSRLAGVKAMLARLMVERRGDRFGLILFGSAPYLQVPFTRDEALFVRLLEEAQVRMAGPKTHLGDAIGLALKHFESSDRKQRVLLLVTDGNDTGSRVPPAEAARLAAGEGIQIHTLAIGDPETPGEAALDREALEAVSRATGGRFFHARSEKDLQAVSRTLAELAPSARERRVSYPRKALYHWPLGMALLLALVVQGWLAWRSRTSWPGSAGGDR